MNTSSVGGTGATVPVTTEELPLELLHGELVCSGILLSDEGDTVSN